MIPTEIDYLDGEVTVEESEPTFEECVQQYGSEMIRKYFVDNLRYRNKHPRVYAKASKDLETLVPRKLLSETPREGKPAKKVFESEINHLRRCLQTKPKETTDAITLHATSEPLYLRAERTGGSGALSKDSLEAANAYFAEGDDKVEAVVQIIEDKVPNYCIERDGENSVSVESLARGIQTLNRHLVKQAKAQLAATLGGSPS